MSTEQFIYLDCPSCKDRMGPYRPKDLRAKNKDGLFEMSFIGCARENTKDAPHRYSDEHTKAVRFQINTKLLGA